LGTLSGIVGIVVIVFITLSDAGHVSGADGIKLILMSMMQMLSLFTSFPIVWPEIFTEIFNVGGSIVVLGQHAVNMKCLLGGVSDLDVFYMNSIFWGLIPIILVIGSVLIWYLMAICCRCINKEKNHLHNNIRTSIVAVLYLVHPTLCAQAFSLFSCRTVCGSQEEFLRIALDEQCYVGRHLMYIYFLALPMLVLYVCGLPLFAWWACYQIKQRAVQRQKLLPALARRRSSIKVIEAEDETHTAYGVLYSVYKPEYFWWEATVVFRKIVIALVGVFGSSLGLLQIHLGLLILAFIIMLTAVVKPYDTHSEDINSNLLQNLELGSLAALWLTLWAGSVFNTYPRCEVPGGIILQHEGYQASLGHGEGKKETLLWCNIMSVIIGLVDILAVVILCIYFLAEKGLLNAVGKWCVQCCSKDGNNDRDDIEQIEQIEMGNIGTNGDIGTNGTNGTMVGLPTPPETPLRMKDVLVAVPSPKKCSESKKSLKEEETIPSLMSFGGAKEKEKSVVSTTMGNGVVIENRVDGTKVIQLSWSAIMYCPIIPTI